MLDNETFEFGIKFITNLSFLIKSFLGNCTAGLYRVQEHIQKRTPTLVKDRKGLQNELLECAISDIEDGVQFILTLPKITAFGNTLNALATYTNKIYQQPESPSKNKFRFF